MQSSIIKIVHELRIARGGNKKLAILKQHADNEPWKRFLLYTYNSSHNYWVSAPNDNTFFDDNAEFDHEGFFSGLACMIRREFKGSLARDYAKELSQKYGEPVRLALKGSINAGVSVKTVNKAYPGWIPTFDIMLAQDVPVEEFPVMGFIKYDGVRVLVHVDPIAETSTAYTRSGKELNLLCLTRAMAVQRPGWYDGELVMGDGLQESRTKVTGNVNKVLKGSCNTFDGYTFQIFDFVSESDWADKKCDTSYISRIKHLTENLVETDKIKLAYYKYMASSKDVNDMYEDLVDKGYEGMILRYMRDPYEWKRTSKLIKKKAKFEGIVKCTGTNPGTGKYEGMIGSLICEGTLDCERKREPTYVEFSMGSGLSDYDRDQDPSYYIGQDIEIQYNDIVLGEGASVSSVFIPVFKRVAINRDI